MNWLIEITRKIFYTIGELFTANIVVLGGQSLSLSSIFKLIFLGIIALFIAQRISLWIGRWLLVRFHFERAKRENIASILTYVLGFLGVLIVLQNAGIDLSSLTVIAGALGIGVGFSLQTLASNFFSGLMLLFERPVNIGDFIEIDDLLGTVEKISMRSTLVRTLDGLVAIVPNNRFVEQNIINWSSCDRKCRLHLPVGVAYGSDPVLVTEALLSAARKDRRILSYPSPKVWLKEFGDSSLNFELLVWIENPPELEHITSSLNFLIESELRLHGLEIPFPQRDLHIRSSNIESSLINLHQPKSPKNAQTNVKVTPKKDPENFANQKPLAQSPNNWNLKDLLRRVSYFESCTDFELRELIESGYRQLFPINQIVCRENDPGESFYLILTGSVEVYSQQSGKYIATLHQGEFFGEISLLMGMPRTASVRSLEDTILFVVNRNDLQQLLLKHHQLADKIAEKLSERQQSLRNLGLLPALHSLEDAPLVWIRQRLSTIFGI